MPATEWGWLVTPDELEEWILQNDEHVLLVNKPALLVCHPSKNGPWSSLAGACREYLDSVRSHLVSRLDRETSGIVLFAKHRLKARHLQMALERRKVDKTYLAIMEGELKAEILVDEPLGPDTRSIVHSKTTVRYDGRKQAAQTRYTPLHSNGRYTLAKVDPITGRKHQIRAHALHLGHSIVGDKLYGPDEGLFLDFIEDGWTDKMASILPINRHALHAYRMTFHLEDGVETYTAPLTDDLREFCFQRLDLDAQRLDGLIEAL
ncbi:RNA pseudouridine synthase [Pelagicoccus sp. SDUM812003]|uniref:RluA family pseudouridine synthase n=1 Tax=Pelagicoccus sp. SDUM812003 TaxID=3041267 RepID=UPI00281022B4|nr:RNA pseudouridine synthase [Pelagicoccus sp. SDUM812003]MDQ8201986.1 RNA pseudouridine synthase [Pelagicoccus sp. SDUM812003]